MSDLPPSLTYLNFLHKLFELFELLNAKIRLLVVQKTKNVYSKYPFLKRQQFSSFNASEHKTLNGIVFSQEALCLSIKECQLLFN